MLGFKRLKMLGAAAVLGLSGCGQPVEPVDPEVLREMSFEQAFADCCEASGGIPQWLYDYLEVNSIWVAPATRETVLREAYLVQNTAAQAHVLDHVRPLDVVLLRNHSRLSGRTSDGWFGHSAVYLGGEEDLRALGIWDHPVVARHHHAFEGGAFAIESVGHDVSLASDHLFEADSMAVFRPEGISRARKGEMVIALLAQVGAPFDHHFRMDNGAALFCTELLDKAMPELNFPVRDVKGHSVILPDEVAIGALTGAVPMAFVTYVDGRRGGHSIGDEYLMAARIIEGWPQPQD